MTIIEQCINHEGNQENHLQKGERVNSVAFIPMLTRENNTSALTKGKAVTVKGFRL